jgi:hypothetical protein
VSTVTSAPLESGASAPPCAARLAIPSKAIHDPTGDVGRSRKALHRSIA